MTDKDMDWQELDDMLHQAFDKASEIYQQRGFQRRIGFGKKPALISVDLANGHGRAILSHAIRIKWIMKLFRACSDCLRLAGQMAIRLSMSPQPMK